MNEKDRERYKEIIESVEELDAVKQAKISGIIQGIELAVKSMEEK